MLSLAQAALLTAQGRREAGVPRIDFVGKAKIQVHQPTKLGWLLFVISFGRRQESIPVTNVR